MKPGVVQVIENDGKTSKYFVSSGSITVNEDSSVQVLAEEAHKVEDIDVSEAKQLLSQYQSQLNSASSEEVGVCMCFYIMQFFNDFTIIQAKAEAAIAVECAEALVRAAE